MLGQWIFSYIVIVAAAAVQFSVYQKNSQKKLKVSDWVVIGFIYVLALVVTTLLVLRVPSPAPAVTNWFKPVSDAIFRFLGK